MAFSLPALRYILGNNLGPTIILFYFLKNKVFSYKTLTSIHFEIHHCNILFS